MCRQLIGSGSVIVRIVFFFPRVSDYNRQATCTCRLAFIILPLWFNADENILSVISITIFIFGTTINPKKKFSACSVFILETLPLEWRINHLFFLTSYATFVVQHSIFTRLGEIVGRERWNHSPVNGEFRMARSPKFFP